MIHMKIARLRLLSVSLGLALVGGITGCTLDGVDHPPGGDLPDRIPNEDPAEDERLDLLGIQCESTLIVTGTWEATTPQPADRPGCWPVGVWTVNATIDRQGCDPQAPVSGDYVYEVTNDDDDNNVITWLNDPEFERVNLKITTAGDSLCHGGFEHYFEDGTAIVLRPNLQLDGSLMGGGEYSVYLEDPW